MVPEFEVVFTDKDPNCDMKSLEEDFEGSTAKDEAMSEIPVGPVEVLTGGDDVLPLRLDHGDDEPVGAWDPPFRLDHGDEPPVG